MLEVLKARVEAVRWARAKTIAKQTSPDCLTPTEVGQHVLPLAVVLGSRRTLSTDDFGSLSTWC